MKCRFTISFSSEVVASSENMTRIQTDTKPIWVFRQSDDIAQMFKAVAEVCALPSSGFKENGDIRCINVFK